jgi:hypothetical protein
MTTIDLLSYEIPATLIHACRSEYPREANRLIDATSYLYSPMKVKVSDWTKVFMTVEVK